MVLFCTDQKKDQVFWSILVITDLIHIFDIIILIAQLFCNCNIDGSIIVVIDRITLLYDLIGLISR